MSANVTASPPQKRVAVTRNQPAPARVGRDAFSLTSVPRASASPRRSRSSGASESGPSARRSRPGWAPNAWRAAAFANVTLNRTPASAPSSRAGATSLYATRSTHGSSALLARGGDEHDGVARAADHGLEEVPVGPEPGHRVEQEQQEAVPCRGEQAHPDARGV